MFVVKAKDNFDQDKFIGPIESLTAAQVVAAMKDGTVYHLEDPYEEGWEL